MKNRILWLAFVLFILVAGGYAYLYPGSEALLAGRTDSVMGDGTDSASLPYGYSIFKNIFETHPSRLFYGSVYSEAGDPEKGQSLWIPWNERWLSVFLGYIVPVEQMSTAFILFIMILNGLAMYLLCEYLKWNRWVSVALSFAWAFNVYTRARAKVHGALAGTYHIPLIFLALLIVVHGRSKRSLVAAMALLLFAGTVAHYYLVTSIFLAPLFIAFVYIQPEARAHLKLVTTRFVLASLPLIFFMGSSYYFMLPSEAPITKAESIAEEVMPDGSAHPFLEVFHAYPIDYLAGDLGMVGSAESNPARQLVNEEILGDMRGSNSHERSNGIRWTVLALATLAFVFLLRGKFKDDVNTHRNLFFFLIFGLFTFWLSLAPDIPSMGFSPSYWLYKFFPKIRVSTRAGIMVHFSLLMAVGYLFTRSFRWRQWLLLPGALLVLFIVDYLPLNTVPMAPIFPAFSELHRDKGRCETGLVFPFINPYATGVNYYFYAQRMRGSDCKIINATARRPEIQLLLNTFPPDINFLRNLTPQVADKVTKLVECMPLNWLVFLEPTPRPFAESICQRLGWKLSSDLTCTGPSRDKPMQRLPSQCL